MVCGLRNKTVGFPVGSLVGVENVEGRISAHRVWARDIASQREEASGTGLMEFLGLFWEERLASMMFECFSPI